MSVVDIDVMLFNPIQNTSCNEKYKSNIANNVILNNIYLFQRHNRDYITYRAKYNPIFKEHNLNNKYIGWIYVIISDIF